MITRNQTKNKTVLTLAAVAMATLAASASAEVTIDDYFTGTLPGQGGVYTIDLSVAAPGFDASGSDKLVVMTGDRGSGGSIWGKDLTGITYGGTPMVEAIKIRNNAVSPNPDGEAVAGIYYLDDPAVATELVISYAGKMDAYGGYTLLALSGTADGVGPTNATVTGEYPGDEVTSASTTLDTTAANSLVLACCAGNRNNPQPVVPLDNTFNGGGSTYGAGSQVVATPGTVTPTFSMAATYMPVVAAAAFEDAFVDPNLPTVDAGVDMITLSGMDVALAPTVVNNDTAVPQKSLSHTWTADPDTGVVITEDGINPDDPATKEATVTITKATANPSTVTLTLKVDLVGTSSTASDTMEIDVYNDPCLAAKAVGPVELAPSDFDENCTTDLRDYAILAAKWLVDYALTEPITKP